jgi:hypothetical protein
MSYLMLKSIQKWRYVRQEMEARGGETGGCVTGQRYQHCVYQGSGRRRVDREHTGRLGSIDKT